MKVKTGVDRALRMENLKLHRQITKLTVQNISLTNRIGALEAELKKQLKATSAFQGLKITVAAPRKSKASAAQQAVPADGPRAARESRR